MIEGWALEGKKVEAYYLGSIQIVGTVVKSRVKYGNGVKHYIDLDEGFASYNGVVGRKAHEVLLIDHKNIYRVFEAVNA